MACSRIVFVASSLHKKAAQPEYEVSPSSIDSLLNGNPWKPMSAYSISKLVQMHLFKIVDDAFAKAGDTKSRATVIAVSPGFVPQTGLSRETSWLSRQFMAYVMPMFPFTTSMEEGRLGAKTIARGMITQNLQSGTYLSPHGEETLAADCLDPILRSRWRDWLISNGVRSREARAGPDLRRLNTGFQPSFPEAGPHASTLRLLPYSVCKVLSISAHMLSFQPTSPFAFSGLKMSTPVPGAPIAISSISPSRAYSYPLELWWAVSSFIALAVLFHLASLVMAHYSKRFAQRSLNTLNESVDEKGSLRSGIQPATNVAPRALRNIPSATLSAMQKVFFRIRTPFHRLHRMNVAEITITIGYLAGRGLTVGLWANRAAHLATSQTPLIVALAGKNNIVTLLTGIGYEKLNVLHRASARSTLILIWVHAFGRWRLGLHGYASLEEIDIRFGVVSMAAFSLAALLSVRPIRNMAYEGFLISHIILVAMYLIFGLLHVPEVKYRFWPALAIWGLDRLLRVLRAIVINKLWTCIFRSGKRLEDATLERVSSDTVRLTVRRSFKWRSGQHAYIVAPSIARLPFEAHPFTIASVYSEDIQKEGRSQEVVFIIRGRDGFTRKLLEASETRQSVPVVIDGPYGAPPRLSHYTTSILIAGGSGVSYTISLLLDLVRQVKSGNGVAQRVLFVWVVRNSSHVDWVDNLLQQALQDCPPALQLSLNIYVTQRSLPQLPRDNELGDTILIKNKESLGEISTTSLASSRKARIFSGRPDIGIILKDELNCASGRVSIDVSGPSALADATRDALVACKEAQPAAVLRGSARTTLHLEISFKWYPAFNLIDFGWAFVHALSINLPLTAELVSLLLYYIKAGPISFPFTFNNVFRFIICILLAVLESPSSQEFVDRPDLRTISAFFLGWTFIACLRYLALAIFRHPFTAHVIRAVLRKPILITVSERQEKNIDLEEGNHVQNWLRSTLENSTRMASDRPEGTRHLSVVLTAAFTLAILTSFLSLLDFQSSDKDVLCIIVIAWAGISVSCGKLAGLLRITFDLQRLGVGRVERIGSWVLLVMSFGATLAHVTISIGATRDVRQIPGLSLCYRRHFLLTSLIVSLLNIVLELYFMGRTFFLLVPHFLQFHHKIEVMMDVRVARVASILALDLLTLLPSALSINTAAEFIPLSLGVLLVLAAFNHHPPKPTDARSFRISSSHRTSVVTFPRNDKPDEQSIVSENEPESKPDEPSTIPVRPSPSNKTSLISESGPKRHTRHKSRDVSRSSHISYDSEAEARSVRGAVVSFAFRSREVEPVPAIPYGIYQPKLMASPVIVSRSPQSSSPVSDIGTHGHSGFRASPSPLSRDSGLPQREEKPLLPPKLFIDTRQSTSNKNSTIVSSDRNLVAHDSDAASSMAPRKPELARHESTRTLSYTTSSGASQGFSYIGPDLYHYSMGSQSITYEARDYLAVPPRATGMIRTSTFGATTKGSRTNSGAGSVSPSLPSTGSGV
ncbi:FAD-binding domain, partial [Rhizoctonia solani]